jgi:hypothetical protein
MLQRFVAMQGDKKRSVAYSTELMLVWKKLRVRNRAAENKKQLNTKNNIKTSNKKQ